MPVPIVCLAPRLRQFLGAFRSCCSKPQLPYCETVVFALLRGAESRTLSGLLRQVAERRSVAGLSRFLARAAWSEEEVAATWRARFAAAVRPQVAQAHRQQRANRPKPWGRPRATVVTGDLIGDASTLAKPQGKRLEGGGSITPRQRAHGCGATVWCRVSIQ